MKERYVNYEKTSAGELVAVVKGLTMEQCMLIQPALEKLADYEDAAAEDRLLILPVAIGERICEKDFPGKFTVIGYRIGRMAGEDEGEFEEEFRQWVDEDGEEHHLVEDAKDELYIQYATYGVEVSTAASNYGDTFYE